MALEDMSTTRQHEADEQTHLMSVIQLIIVVSSPISSKSGYNESIMCVSSHCMSVSTNL